MAKSHSSLQQAASTRIDLRGDVLTFPYDNADGLSWEGCLEEWIGNTDNAQEDRSYLDVELAGERYFQIGASGGGADLLLLHANDASIWYLNDYDRTLSRVALNVSEFLAILRTPGGG